MTFITISDVERSLRVNGAVRTLQLHGRKRVAPGFTVADYVRIGEFFLHSDDPHRGDFSHWDKLAGFVTA